MSSCKLCQVFEQFKLGGQEGVRGQEDVLVVDGDVVDDDGCDGEVSAGVAGGCRRWSGAQVDKDKLLIIIDYQQLIGIHGSYKYI